LIYKKRKKNTKTPPIICLQKLQKKKEIHVLINQSTKIWVLDQQRAFDRVEWGWVDHVLSKFNFGEQFTEWVQMLFKYAQT